jgi:hypothetical protein
VKNLLLIVILIAAAFFAGIYYTKHPTFTKEKPFIWTRAATETTETAYYLKAFRRGKFIFEHNGHTLTVKCRITLTWLGDDTEGKPMNEPGNCVYVTPGNVGKYYGSDLMGEYNTELHFMPYLGQKTSQTADIMDIESDELVTKP